MKFKIAIQTPKGTHDLVKENAEMFLNFIFEASKHSYAYGFEYIRTPVIEYEEVFTSSLGLVSDVVEKEMFYIKREKGNYVLRPEGTAPIVRAYFQNGMHTWKQPVELFYIAPMFRYEKPQLGRYREHYQWGLEILNSNDPIYDAKVILTFDRFLKKFKLTDYVFRINSLGCSNDREKYKKDLKKYYKKHLKNLCNDCKKRYKVNPLRLLDCKVDQEYKKDAPNILNYLCNECEKHFNSVLEYIETLEINYELDHTLVRGFDYYSKTVFELYFKEVPVAIISGGRYDNLGKALGGAVLPSVGGSLGVERFMEIIKMHNVSLKSIKTQPKIFVAYVTDKAKAYALSVYDLLLRNNFPVAENFGKPTLSSQLEIANKMGVSYCVIIGHKELGTKSVILKNMKDGIQETIPLNQLFEELKSRKL